MRRKSSEKRKQNTVSVIVGVEVNGQGVVTEGAYHRDGDEEHLDPALVERGETRTWTA